MKKETRQIAEGIRYLSDWDGFDSLPQHEHYILAKEICGCGATEAFINSSRPVIIAMPRKHLLYNKYSQHIGDAIFLYRFLDREQYFSDKTPTKEELEDFDRLLIDYIRGGGSKILTTYDSLHKITQLMQTEGIDLKQYRVVVDEFQQIIGDAPFKASIEHQFYNALKRFESVVYLSATPFLQSYLEMTDQFRDLKFIQLQWPEQSIKKADVKAVKLTKSISAKCCEIISNYRTGNNVPYVIDENQTRIESKEAVIFLNNVKSIIDVIKKSALTPEEVNILCAPRKENLERIHQLNKGISEGKNKFRIGYIPGKGEAHKKFTFCTSTAYIGADFYSTTAYSYIFANPNVESLTIDVGTDLQQIVGRQRREDNPFRMKADLYYYLKKPLVSKEDMDKIIESKREETRRHIENYEKVIHKESMLKSIEALINKGHNDQYCCISEDIQGNRTIVENSLIAIAEKRAWDIANTIYNGDLSLIKALKESVNIVRDVDSTDPEVKRIFDEWTKDNQFKRQAMMYCELHEKRPELLTRCTFIPKYFHDYFEALGKKGFEDLHWRQDYIKEALAPIPIDKIPHEEIIEQLKKKFDEGSEYPKEDIKRAMIDIYRELGIKGKPSASDIQRYFTIKESSKRINKKKTATIRILSYWQKRISLFQTITKVKNPIEESDVDSVLKIIKSGDKFKLKSRITQLHPINTKEELSHRKMALPVATWNGVFNYRDTSGCSVYSSFTAIDFDHIGDMEGHKALLRTFPCVYAYFMTPSGHGLKAIILHDNRRKENHADLYAQLLSLFNCDGTDSSTSDLGRGNYLSYDSDLWINPQAEPFHYVRSDMTDEPTIHTRTVIKDSKNREILIDDDDSTSAFLNKLSTMILTDESIINMLRFKWTQQSITRGRNNTALTYAGILCKAGVEQAKAIRFIMELIPSLPHKEIIRAARYAYEHNIFGCNRRTYLKHKR